MFLDKLTRALGEALRPKPRYITVTPVTERPAAPVLRSFHIEGSAAEQESLEIL